MLGAVVYHLTKSVTLGYGTGMLILIAAIVTVFVDASALSRLLPAAMQSLSLFDRFSAFVNGVFDMTSIVFYLSVIAFFLLLTVQSLEKRRYN